MLSEQSIKCPFCQGTGNNPHFRGICPVCKGRGKNEMVGKYMTCSSCRGSGRKGDTTLTCYDCGGLGLIPDTGETFRQAREEIGEARKDLARERQELTEKPKSKKHMFLKRKDEEDETHFCQCCGDKVNESVTVKVCFGCFSKVKELRAYKGI